MACMCKGVNGATLNVIDISGDPIKACILMKKKDDYISEDLVTGFGNVMDSGRHCSQRIQSKDSDAGANAGLREDMAVEATNSLSELVWSPETGLRLKCTNCHFPERKIITQPSTTEPEIITILPPQTIETKKCNHHASLVEGNLGSVPMTTKSDKEIDRVKPPRSIVRIMPVCQISGNYFNTGQCGDLEGDQSAVNKKQTCPPGGMVMTFPEEDSVLGPEIGESAFPSSSAFKGPKPNLETIEANFVDLNEETGCEGLEKSRSLSYGENIQVVDLAVKRYGKSPKSSLPISRSCNFKGAVPLAVNEKDSGKNKDAEIEVGARINEAKDDSHESVESSTSERLFSTAKRAWNFEQKQIIEHKKLKLNDGTPISTLFLKQDSSFLGWIFNMTNRLSKSNPDELSLCRSSAKSFHVEQGNHDLLLGSHDTKHSDGGNRRIGFQSMFRSMYFPSSGLQSKKDEDFEQQIGAESSKNIEVVDDGLRNHNSNSRPCDENDVKLNNFSAKITKDKLKNTNSESSYSCKRPSPSEDERASKAGFTCRNKSSNLVRSGSSPFDSLWISRLSPKVSAPTLKYLPSNQDVSAVQEPSIEHQVGDTGQKLQSCSINPTGTSRSKKSNNKSDEKMKNKLNHTLLSESSAGQHDSSIPCKKNLELLKSPEAMSPVCAQKMDTISRSGRLTKGKELINHAYSSNDLTEMVNFNSSLLGSKPVKNDLLVVEDNCFKVMARKRQDFSSFREDDSKENQIASYNPINRQVLAVQKGIFEMVRKLRLSRSHVLRWLRSPHPSFPFEGFFLRLRLGKWEEELGGTGYHVACIIGRCQESSCGSYRFPLFVKLGGVKCLVDCRYVSNHDFVEEELMAWWSAALRGDDKLPSEEELNLKLQEKQKWDI